MNGAPAGSASTLAPIWRDLYILLRTRPLICLAATFILGIVWADYAAPAPLVIALLCVICVFVAWLLIRAEVTGADYALLLALFVLGATLHSLRISPRASDRLAPAGVQFSRAVGVVEEVQLQTAHVQLAVVLLTAEDTQPARRKVRLTLPAQPLIGIGDEVVMGEVGLWPPRRSGTPGEPDPARLLPREGIHALGKAAVMGKGPRRSLRGRVNLSLDGLRGHMLETLTAAMPEPGARLHAELLASMVYGMRAAVLAPDLKDLFRRSGTIHLLVVSGTQVTVIAFSLIFLIRGSRRVLPLWGMLVVVAGLLALALLAGFGASVNRAITMAVVLLGTFAVGRQYDFPTAAALSALVLCGLNTATVFDIGAQLTYACCVGVYLALPERQPQAQRRAWSSWWRAIVLGSLGAWVFASPIIVWHFHQLVLIGALANLLAIPLATALLYLGLLGIGLALLSPALAAPLCHLARLLLELLLTQNRFFASLPGATVEPVYAGPLTVLVWYALALAVVLALRLPAARNLRGRLDGRWIITGAVAAVGIVFLLVAAVRLQPERLRVDVLDVGAAQCLLIRTSAGAVMVDAGAEPAGGEVTASVQRRVLTYLALQRVRRLEALIITHAHEDHCNLATAILEQIPTRRLLLGPEVAADRSWVALRQHAHLHQLAVEPVQAGQVLRLGRAVVEVLEPTGLLTGTNDDANNNSTVLRVSYGKTRVLLPADLELEGEQRLLEDYRCQPERLRAEVLVAAHHASVRSNHAELLDAVQPCCVVISCGRGKRAPRTEALQRFTDRGLPVWRTDLLGTLQVISDGRKVWVKGHRKQW